MTAPQTTTELLDVLRQAGIRVPDNLPDLPADPSHAVGVLVKSHVLTGFQGRLILAGKQRGLRIGPYVILDVLGQGGMGVVYRAEHELLRRRVALKVLKTAGGVQPVAVERFLREARSAAALDHPNIVRLFDVGKHGSLHYLVMEFIEGRTLQGMLAAGGSFNPGRAADYVAQAAAGLQHAHEKGFVHRDIKPANLMVTREGVVKVLDMGLTRSDDEEDQLTRRNDKNAVLGTTDYIAPEQAVNSPHLDGRADIYSLGATLYTLVAGHPPFDGSATQKLLHHQMHQPTPLTSFDPTLPPALGAIVTRMMAKNPDDRYASMTEVIEALHPWRATPTPTPGTARSSEIRQARQDTPSNNSSSMQPTQPLRPSLPEPPIPVPPRRSVLPLLIGVCVAGLFAVVGYALMAMLLGGNAATPTPLASGPEPTKPEETKPTPTVPEPTKPAVVMPEDRAIYRLDLSQIPPFRFQHMDGKRTVLGGREPKLPIGLRGQSRLKDCKSEFFLEEMEGEPVLGLVHLSGPASGQYIFELERDMGIPIEEEAEYHIIIEFRSVASGFGYLQALDGVYKGIGTLNLKDTAGQWKTVRLPFKKPAGSGPFRSTFNLTSADEGNGLLLRKFEVVPAG